MTAEEIVEEYKELMFWGSEQSYALALEILSLKERLSKLECQCGHKACCPKK